MSFIGGNTKNSVGKTTYSNKIKLNDERDIGTLDETTFTLVAKTKKDFTKNQLPPLVMRFGIVVEIGSKIPGLMKKKSPQKSQKKIISYKQLRRKYSSSKLQFL